MGYAFKIKNYFIFTIYTNCFIHLDQNEQKKHQCFNQWPASQPKVFTQILQLVTSNQFLIIKSFHKNLFIVLRDVM